MPLRIEEWDHRPPEDDAQWEEVFESSLRVRGGVRYAVRIAGRGFVNRGWPGSTTPGDAWRIQLWLSAEDVPDRRIKEWHPPDCISDQVP